MGVDGTRKRKRHAGGILAIVLVCLLVVMLLGSQLIQATVIWHRQTRQAEQRQQAFWLAESAVRRAVHALEQSPDYGGETWRVSRGDLVDSQTGRAVITVAPAGDAESGQVIRVEAYWPDDPVHRVLCEREYLVD